MAVYPETIVDLTELPRENRIAMIVTEIEDKIDFDLRAQRFERVERGFYNESSYEWLELNKQLNKSNKGVAYVLDFGGNRLDLGDFEINEIQAAYKKVRRLYQSYDWFNVIFNTEGKAIYNIAIIKEGVWNG